MRAAWLHVALLFVNLGLTDADLSDVVQSKAPSLSRPLSPEAVRQKASRARRVRGLAVEDPLERGAGDEQDEESEEVPEVLSPALISPMVPQPLTAAAQTLHLKRPLSFLASKSLFFMRSEATAPSPRAHLLVCAGLFVLVVILSISAVMVGDDGPRGKRARSAAKGESADSQPSVLVASLVVPRGKEFLFAIKQVVSGARQKERFDMVDPENKPFCSVLIAESGPPSAPAFRGLYGILLEHAGEALAFLHTEDWHAKQSPVCPLYRKDGELFGYLMRDRDPPRRYSIVAPHTGDTLLSFHGDFREQSVNVHNGHGQLVATTERQAFAFALDRFVQVRVAPCVDASLVMLGLLGIAKMEN